MKPFTYIYEIGRLFRPVKELPVWIQSMPLIHEQIRMIREALGMTQAQLASRLKIRQHAVAQFESQSEGNLKLSTLQKVARELHCEVIVTLVPKEDLPEFLDRKALETAKKILSISERSNAIELQKPEENVIQLSQKRLKDEILEKNRSLIWKKGDA